MSVILPVDFCAAASEYARKRTKMNIRGYTMRLSTIFTFAALSVFLLSARPLLAADDDDGSGAAGQSQFDDAETMASDDVAASEDGPDTQDDADQDSGGGKLTAGLVAGLGSACLCPPLALGGGCLYCPLVPTGFAALAGGGVITANLFNSRETTLHSLLWPMIAGAGVGTLFSGLGLGTAIALNVNFYDPALRGVSQTNRYIVYDKY